MSGDHRNTANYKKELFTKSGFKQYRNTTLFSKGSILILSPAVAKNQQGGYWFDVREVIISQYNPSQHNKFVVVVRVVPDRFIVFDYSVLKKIIKTESKTENTGNKVWSFEIENTLSVIVNKKSNQESISVSPIAEQELVKKLKNI